MKQIVTKTCKFHLKTPLLQTGVMDRYFPFTKNADTAVKNLNNLMHRNPDLLAELAGSPLHHIIVEC